MFFEKRWFEYGARMYDPAIGRWHSLDLRAELAVSITPYRYGLNNPVRFTDPDGKTEYERVRALEYARKFVNQNTTGANCYGSAGYHSGEPGSIIDCSGLVSQAAHYAGVGHLNNAPEQGNGVANILNQSIINTMDPTEIVPGNIVTMSNRMVWNGTPVGHVALIEAITRDKEGNIMGLTLLHSKDGAGPVRQYVDFNDPDDEYAHLISTFNYWSWDHAEGKSEVDETSGSSKRNRNGYDTGSKRSKKANDAFWSAFRYYLSRGTGSLAKFLEIMGIDNNSN